MMRTGPSSDVATPGLPKAEELVEVRGARSRAGSDPRQVSGSILDEMGSAFCDLCRVQRHPSDVQERGGHFHIAYADRQHRYDSGPPLKLLAHRQGDLLAAPVGPHRRRADQGSHEVELCDGFGHALNERVADQQLALVDPDACAQRLRRRREFLREATVLVRITDEEGGLAGHISNLGD